MTHRATVAVVVMEEVKVAVVRVEVMEVVELMGEEVRSPQEELVAEAEAEATEAVEMEAVARVVA